MTSTTGFTHSPTSFGDSAQFCHNTQNQLPSPPYSSSTVSPRSARDTTPLSPTDSVGSLRDHATEALQKTQATASLLCSIIPSGDAFPRVLEDPAYKYYISANTEAEKEINSLSAPIIYGKTNIGDYQVQRRLDMVQVIEAEVYERWETMRAACGLLMMSQGLVRNESHRKVVVENDEGDTEVEDQHHETNIQWENEVAGVGKKSTARGGTLDSGGNRDAPYDQPIRISKPSCARNCKHVSRRSGKKADLAPQTPPNRAENDDTDTSPAPATVEEALQPKKIIIRLRLPKPKPKRKLEEVENGEVKKGEKKRKRK